jgi:hypothetical protein
VSNITIRRCVVADAYCTADRSQGFYAMEVNGVTLEQNVFDHNGWNQQISGAGDNGYNHNIYYSATALNMTVRGNIIADASSQGVLARGGGVIEGNLFLHNAVGISYGNANGADSTPGGVTGRINGNVFIDDKGIAAGKMGVGVEIGNIKPHSGFTLSDNVFTHDTQQNSAAINLTFAGVTNNPAACVGINDATISGNIVSGWRNGLTIDGGFVDGGSGLKALNDLTVTGNDFEQSVSVVARHSNAFSSSAEHFSGNNYFTSNQNSSNQLALKTTNLSLSAWQKAVEPSATSVAREYADASRTAGTYNATLGGEATLDAFLAQADAQSSDSWRTTYTAAAVINYVRQGFGLSTNPASPPPVTAKTGSISGTVFNDVNANLKRDKGEGVLSAWKVYIDANDNHKFDAGEQYTTTDASGNYELSNVTAGYHIVRVAKPGGWTQTLPVQDMGQHITVGSGQNVTRADFGERKIA